MGDPWAWTPVVIHLEEWLQVYESCAQLLSVAGMGAARELLQPSLVAALTEFLKPEAGTSSPCS